MRIVCWQTILVKYHTLFFSKILQNNGYHEEKVGGTAIFNLSLIN